MLLKTRQNQGELQKLQLHCDILCSHKKHSIYWDPFSYYFQKNKSVYAEVSLAVPVWGWNQTVFNPSLPLQIDSQIQEMLNTYCSAGGVRLPLPKTLAIPFAPTSQYHWCIFSLLFVHFPLDSDKWATGNNTCKEGKS